MAHDIIFLLLGLILIVIGGNSVTDGAVTVAQRFRLSPLLIGVTVVAFGSSTPDFVVSFISTLKGKSELAIGDVIGANIFDLLLVVGVVAMVHPIHLRPTSWRFNLPMLLLSSFVLFICGDDRLVDGFPANIITRSEGIMMLLFFCYFMDRSLQYARQNSLATDPVDHAAAHTIAAQEAQADDVGKKSRGWRRRLADLYLVRKWDTEMRHIDASRTLRMWKAAILIVIGLAALTFGGNWLVDGASGIAKRLGMSEAMIGLTIVAIGGSIPDLATSLIAAIKGQTQIAMGNIVGACIFNVFFILGFCAVVHPLEAGNITPLDFSTLLAASMLLVVFGSLMKSHTIHRGEGAILILGYVGYMLYLILHAL